MIYNQDCLEAMKKMSDNQFDLAIVDPPYGINIAKWDAIDMKPNNEYFIELLRVSKNQIIWGGNYFNLPISQNWICWNKTMKQHKWRKNKKCFEFELAWTSLDIKTKIINFTDFGNTNGFDGKLKVNYSFKGKIHPTQKHSKLYEWLLMNYAKKGDTILDTHLGSGSIAIACYNLGFDLTGYEIDKEYFKVATKRIEQHKAQIRLF
jgi:site-specific DNA-methyltransferase (adenine-specific)